MKFSIISRFSSTLIAFGIVSNSDPICDEKIFMIWPVFQWLKCHQENLYLQFSELK